MKNRICASILLFAMVFTFIPMQLFALGVVADEQTAVEIEFDTNGGTLISSQTIKKGETITEPDDPTKEGYLFAGWTLNNNPYDFRTPVTESMTLVATWVANSIPSATIGVDILQIDPAYLQMWNDMSLQVATVTTRNCTRSDGYKYTRFFRWDVSLTYYSLDPSIASVSNDGTITSHKLGHTYIWAVSNETKSATFEGSDVSITQGDILEKIEVVVEETPSYYKNYLENPNTQKITLETNTNQNTSIFTSKPESTFGSANIALFYGDTISAFTMTCDDNIMGDFDKWNTLLEEYGIPVTFMAPAYAYYESGAIWQELIYLGHNIQSHSHYHNSSAEYQDGLTTAQAWADFYYGTLDIEKTGIDSLAIAYPCGWNKSSISSMLYIAGRGTRSGMNSMSVEYNCINSYSGFPTNISSSLSQAGYWGCVHSHKMGSIDSNRTQYAQLKTLIDNGTLWATTFEKVAQYAQERDTASVTMYSADQENGVIIFNVTDQMNDELYYQPLTIKITVDNTWEHARATQNGVERAVEIVKENGHTYAYVDAVPDQGNILLIKTTVEETVEENTITVTLSDCGYHSTVPMTITKELDGTVFDNILVSQGSTTLESTVSQKGGKTYVTFTGYVGETIVIQAKEDVSSCSMTDLYSGRYSPKDGMTITISNATELVLLSDYTNTRRQTKNLTFVLTQDIDMSQIENFIPIGWYVLRESSSSDYFTCSFEGTFDGGEHTIYNFYQNQEYYGSGLFGYAVGATIENFTLKGSIIGHKRVGAICGILNYGIVQNVTFEGNVTSVGIDGDRKSGSYVGVLAGQTIGSTFTNCIVKNTSVITKAATPLTKLRNSYDAAGSSDFNREIM